MIQARPALRRSLPSLFAAACAWLLACGAATAADDEAASIRLLAFSRVGAEMEVNITGPDGTELAKQPLALPTQQLSPTQTVPSRTLRFVSSKDPAKILGKVQLPASGHEFVLVFLPNTAGAAESYKIDAVALPGSEFGSGDYAFINYSGHGVGCVIDKEKFQIPSGKATVYQMKKSGKGAGNRTFLCYEQQKDGKWSTTPFISSRIIFQEGVRTLVLICLDPRTGQIDFRGLPDFITPPDKKK